MARKRTPLDALDRLEMRVSWQDVERRSDDVPTFEPYRPAPRRARLVAAVTAFAVFIPVAVFAWVALRRTDDQVVAGPVAPQVVLALTEGSDDGFPTATLTFEGSTQRSQRGAGGWKGRIIDASTPDLSDFLVIPQGAELVLDGSASRVSAELGDPSAFPFRPFELGILDLSDGRDAIDVGPGRYALTVDARWPDGGFAFYFGIEIVDEPASDVFFPTWEMDARPEALVHGTLVERDGCLFSFSGDSESLILWERGLSYSNGEVLDADGHVVARVGEAFDGAGGSYSTSDRVFAEDLIGEAIPDRCMPAGDADGLVLVYDVALADAGGEPTGPEATTGSGAAIVVTSPLPGDVLTTPVTIEGTANVFEGTVRIRIHDAINNLIVDTHTTASCGSGCEGTFSIPVEFSVAEEQQGEIVVFEESAETGKPINQVRIPVTLLPGPTVEEARAFVGEWTDASGQRADADVVSSILGPEHCSWGDIVLLRLATGSGGDITTYVRDTSGELSDYTRGSWEVVGEPDGGLVDTGYRVNGRELWTDPSDPSYVILWDPANDVTERWPALDPEIACA